MSEPSVSAVAGLVAFMCIFARRYYSKIQCGHLNPFAGIISLSLISLKDYVFHLLFWRNVYVQYIIISFSYLSCIYIYIYKSTSTKRQQLTHIRNAVHLFHSYPFGFSGGGRALLPRPSSGTARDLDPQPLVSVSSNGPGFFF